MKFTIRDLFLVTMIVALVLGWWIDHRGASDREREWNNARRDADFWSGAWVNAMKELKKERAKSPAMPTSSALAPKPPKP